MAIQFVLGRSGTGKTRFCYDAILDDLQRDDSDRPLLLLVPEQASYQAERAILSDPRISGYHRFHVVSFDRLRLLLMGNGGGTEMSRLGQEMVVYKLLRSCRESLQVFGRSAETPGLATHLARILTEMHQYAKEPDDLRGLVVDVEKEHGGSLTARKFADIECIFRAYHDFMRGREERFVNAEYQLTQAVRLVKESDLLRGARLWIDGFSGFTAQELEMVAELLRVAGDASIALLMDPDLADLNNADSSKVDPIRLFYATERTHGQLLEIVRKNKLPLIDPILLRKPHRFAKAPDLAQIEKYILESASGSVPEPVQPAGQVRIVSAPNPRAEVLWAGKEIARLVREEGYRYRDIAVIASDLVGYQRYLEAVFTDLEIPYFIDRPRSLQNHPVVELIVSALRAVLHDFSNIDVFAYLKTGLAPAEQEEISLLENYCQAFGVDRQDWLAGAWRYAGPEDTLFDEPRVNEVRARAAAPLVRLRQALGGGLMGTMTAEEFTVAVWGFLLNLDVPKRLSDWSGDDPDDTLAHRQLYDKIVELFDEFTSVFDEDRLEVEQLAFVLSQALTRLTLKLVPPMLDQVLIGSIERSRHPELRAVFLLGAAQKQFPVPISHDPVLTDEDRVVAEGFEFELSDQTQRQLTGRQYLAYVAFTRPSEALYISYPQVTEGGAAMTPSQFVNQLQALFSGPLVEFAGPADGADHLITRVRLEEILCEQLGRDSRISDAGWEQLMDVAACLCREERADLAAICERIIQCISYCNAAALDEGQARAFFDDRLDVSSTRLSSFAACPYEHFAKYMLRLKPAKVFGLEPVDIGTFYHEVLDRLVRGMKEDGEDFKTLDDAELVERVTRLVDRVSRGSAMLSNFAQRSQQNAFILENAREVLVDCVRSLAAMSRAGSFAPAASEMRFGDKDHPVRLNVDGNGGDRVILHGCVDRIDVADTKEGRAAVVFDYKRTGKSFSWQRFYYGLDLQLGIYLLALMQAAPEGAGVDAAAGAFFVPIEVNPKATSLDDLSENDAPPLRKAVGVFDGRFAFDLDAEPGRWGSAFYNFSLKEGEPYGRFATSGAVRPDEFQRLLEFARRKIIAISEEILAGHIEIKPYRLQRHSPCGYCDYRTVCKFDWQINDYNILRAMDKQTTLDAMGEA